MQQNAVKGGLCATCTYSSHSLLLQSPLQKHSREHTPAKIWEVSACLMLFLVVKSNCSFFGSAITGEALSSKHTTRQTQINIWAENEVCKHSMWPCLEHRFAKNCLCCNPFIASPSQQITKKMNLASGGRVRKVKKEWDVVWIHGKRLGKWLFCEGTVYFQFSILVT